MTSSALETPIPRCTPTGGDEDIAIGGVVGVVGVSPT
jgi:hypothetical protein